MVNNFTYAEDKTPMDLHHECDFSEISFCLSRFNSSHLLTLAASRCSRAVTSGPDTTSVMWHRALVSTGNKYHWLMYSPGEMIYSMKHKCLTSNNSYFKTTISHNGGDYRCIQTDT